MLKIVVTLLLLGLVAGCTPSSESLSATVESRARATVAVYRPPTQSPYPTASAYPAERAATATPYPTASPYPTATDYPTPAPTETAALTPVEDSTSTPGAAPVAQPTSPRAPTAESLLETMLAMRLDLQAFGGLIDAAVNGDGTIDCSVIVDSFEAIVAYPAMDVAGSDPAVQNAYGSYRAAVDRLMGVGPGSSVAATDMVNTCREVLAGTSQGPIPALQWTAARKVVDLAIGILSPAIVSLGGE
jgi:hypothetical protein